MRSQPTAALVLLLYGIVCTVASASSLADTKQLGNDSSNWCRWLDKTGKGITRFSVLPGSGWDNLRNRDMGMIADLSFRHCALSDDGTYVTPKHVFLYPKRESQVSLISNVMEHYENYTSSTSVSVNLGGNGVYEGIGIDGKLSEEFQQVKKTALASKTQIGRTQQRYNMYTAQLQPDFQFSESFSNRLADIGNALINNQTAMARYLSDLLIRDFGTHVVTSVDAGAILEKLDYFDKSSFSSSTFTSNKVSMCMSVSFAKVFGISVDSSVTVTNEEVKQYINSVQKTSVNTHGGPPIGAKIDLANWESRLRENLVAIDKIGEPIFGVISQRSLPRLPLPYLKGVINSVKGAVMRYYKANEVKGCQDPQSANFDPIANIGGACQPPMTNFSFAGVFQTCRETRPDLGLGLCGRSGSPVQKNPITGDFRCPTGYEPVQLLSLPGPVGTRCYERKCSCWLFFSCRCGTDCYQSHTTLDSYWCSAIKDAKLSQDSGMIFGGAYSPRFNNPATDAKACGTRYRPYTVGRDISLCLSADVHDASPSRLPLGGFFTCQWGNPLAEPGRRLVALGGSGWGQAQQPPRRCPDGFSQSTVDLVDGCEFMQCARVGADLRRGVARRPPFEAADFSYSAPPVTMVESAGRFWQLVNSTGDWVYLGYNGNGDVVSAESGSSASLSRVDLLVALLGGIVLVIAAALGFAYRRRLHRAIVSRRRGGGEGYRRLDGASVESLVSPAAGGGGGGASGGYGTVNSETTVSVEPVGH